MHDTHTLRTICQRDEVIRRYFLDVYAADQAPCQAPYPRCAIVNTDPIELPGQHWVAVFWTGPDQGEFFDSYAMPPSRYDPRWRCWSHFEQNPRVLQQWTTDVCGDYVLYYLYHRCRGTPLQRIVHYFSPTDDVYNDMAVVQRMHHLFPLSSQTHPALKGAQICIRRRDHSCYDVKKNKSI